MALEAGGYAEKLGNKYEANWIAYQFLRLLEEKITSVIIEPLGQDEIGVDVVISLLNNEHEHHQCKAGSGNSEFWTLSNLNQSKLLANAKYQIDRGATEFHLVSPLACKKITDLGESALNSSGIAQDFIKYQIDVSKERRKDFESICSYLGFDIKIDSDIEKAIYFLQKLKITPYIINKHSTCELEDKAANLFLGTPIKLINFLKNYPVEFNKLRKKITSHELLTDLKASGFNVRLIPDDSRISSVIENLSTDFSESIKPFLISSQIITRTELHETINSINRNAVTLIKAEAGMGKSALLLELHEKLCSVNVISVPIRLDRKRPENNADAFGHSLGFPYSPILSLSKFSSGQKIVIILDQLDAIRWTATHSNNALQVCQQMVRQVLSLREDGVDISIVMASRNFDVSEDVALSSWTNSLVDDLEEIYVSKLDDIVVAKLISSYENHTNLSNEKKHILQIPLWLSIYLTIAQRTKSAPQFHNKLELVKGYWEDRLSEINAYNTTEGDARRLIDEIVALMTSKSRLSISENTLTIGYKNTLQALLSVGLLTKQSQRISFRHQALYDYQVGIKLFNAGISSPEALIEEIGDLGNQTLTKREHLKYGLNMLLDSDQREFCNCALAILCSRNIRFHLKYLTLNSIKEMGFLTKPAKLMINKIIQQTDLLNKFLSNSCYENQNIISHLSESGAIAKWLKGSNEELIDTTLRLLSSIAEFSPTTVIKELKPFIGKSELWNNRAYRGLCWEMENDSDDMFTLRIELFSLGCKVNYINWKTLSKKTPDRALILIEAMLTHYKSALCISRYSPEAKKLETFARRDNWSSTDLEEITNLAKVIPDKLISELLKLISDIVNELDNKLISEQWLFKDKHSNYEPLESLTNGVFSIIVLSGEQLSSDSTKLMALIQPYLNDTNAVVTHLIAKLLLNLSLEYADTVIAWLLQAPESRFRCGNKYIEPVCILPGKLIEKFSANCSIEIFNTLEKEIYYSTPTKDIESIKRCLKYRSQGFYYSFWGETQYFLQPQLSEERIRDRTKQLISVLNRKFSNYTNNDFCFASNHRGGVITSPLPLGNLLSDKSWIKLILTPAEKTNSRNWKQIGKEVISEASVEQFARNLDYSVKNEPTRFAQLALQLPENLDREYIDAFYWGFSEINTKSVNEKYQENWQPCPIDLIEKVINHFCNKQCERSLVRLIERRVDEGSWSNNSIKLLTSLAKNADDPVSDKLNVRNIKKSDSAYDADIGTLQSNAINCVRGMAYGGISKIFWNDKNYALENKHLIDSAIDDPHPAVNITSIDLLLPMANYDNSYALEKFIELCDKDLRMTCGRGAHYFFNNGFEGKDQQKFVNLVMRMLDYPLDEVQKEAARQVYARWFFNELFEDKIELVLKGNINLREGCASVVKQFLEEDKYHDKILKLEPAYKTLVNDNDTGILRKIGGCIGSEHYWTKQNVNNLFDVFVKSESAKYCLFELFHTLENYSGALTELSDPLLDLVTNLTNNQNKNQSNLHMNISDSSLITVLQRLYDEASEDEDETAINTCLDIWDKLLQSELFSAINAAKELDKGLLS